MATPYVRIHEALQEFLTDRESLGRAPDTIRFYCTHLTRFADSLSDPGTKSVGDLSRCGLRGFFAHLRWQDIAHNTVAAYDRAIRVFLRFCVLERYMERDLMKGRPRIKQSRGLPETWNDDEITALLDTCKDGTTGAHDRAPLLLLLDTGLRAGELVGLKVIIKSIYYDGQVPRVESDKYAEISNTSDAPINIGGWRLNASDPGQDFIFPSFDLQPGQTCWEYTNEVRPEHCGFSFGIGRAIWSSKGIAGTCMMRVGQR